MDFLRSLFGKKPSVTQIGEAVEGKSKEADSTMEFSPEVQQQILKVRQDNPTLTENMLDKDIVVLLQQADQTLASGKPMAFLISRTKDTQANVEKQDLSKMTAKELVLHGEELKKIGQMREAEQIFYDAIERAKQTNDLLYQSWAFQFLGDICKDSGDLSQAVMKYREAMELAEQIGNQDGQHLICLIYNGLGKAYFKYGDFPKAIENFKKGIKICNQIGDVRELAITTADLGNAYLFQGDFEQAIQAYNENLELSIKSGSDNGIANAYTRFGVVYMGQGRYDLAIEMLNKSLEICSRIGNQRDASLNYQNLGLAYSDLGNYRLAIEMYQRGMGIMEQIGDETSIAHVHSNLANAFKAIGNFEQAQSHYIQALKIVERIGDRHGEALYNFNLGQLYREKGKTLQARTHIRKAQELFELVGDKQKTQIASQVLRSL